MQTGPWLTHRHNLPVERLVAIGHGHPRQELLLGVRLGGVIDHRLLLVEHTLDLME